MNNAFPSQRRPSGAIPTATEVEARYRAAASQDPLIAPHARMVFDVVEKLGEGGMGAVYKVNDTRLSRLAALKMLSQSQDNQHAQSRFLREAMITARLDHPAIPSVYEAGRTAGGELYLLMKLIEGQTLRERIDLLHDDGCPHPELLELLGALARVGEAIAYAHSQGIIHRDLKPENIMIGAFGEVLVIDWGIAKDQQDSQTEERQLRSQLELLGELAEIPDGLTAAGSFLGTPGYAAPEQLDGEELGERADVFALGLILTEILTGEAAIPGETGTNKVRALASGKVMTPRQLRRSVPRSLDWIARQAVQFQVKDRTRSAALFVEQLKAWLADQPIPRYRYGLGERMTRLVNRRPVTFLSLFMTSILVALAFVLAGALEDSKQTSQELNIAKREEERARDIADRAQEVLSLFVEAEDMAQRGGDKARLKQKIDKALSLSERDYPQLLRAAKIYEELNWVSEQKLLLEEAAARFSPAYDALFALHVIQLEGNSDFLHVTNALQRLLDLAKDRGDENEFTLFFEAKKAQLAGQLKKAIEIYDRAEKYSTRFDSLYNNRGVAKDALGDKEGSLIDMGKALQISPRSPSMLVNRGRMLHNAGRYQDALNDFDKAIEVRPGYYRAFLRRGLTKAALGDERAAEVDFSVATVIDRNASKAFHNRAIMRYKLGKFEESLKDYQVVESLNPKNADLYFNRSKLYLDRRDYDGVIQDCSTAIRLRSNYAKAFDLRGKAWKAKGQLKKALADLNTALRLDPQLVHLYFERSQVFTALGDKRSALQDLQRAIQANPRDARPYCSRASIYADFKQIEKSLADCNTAIRLQPQSTLGYFTRASLYKTIGQGKKALADVNQALRLQPKDHGAYNLRAGIKLLLKDKQGALADYNKAIELKNDYARAYNNRATLHFTLGLRDKALSDTNTALKLEPNFARAYLNRGAIRKGMGDIRGGIADVRIFIKLRPKDPLVPKLKASIRQLEAKLPKKP